MEDFKKPEFSSRKVYPSAGHSAQDMAYALAKYLDTEKHLITQIMRQRDGYLVQCRGDAQAEWTKYLGLDAAVSVRLTEEGDNLAVTVYADKWVEKAGLAVAGLFFHPLMATAGVGALRQFTLFDDIFDYVEDFLGTAPIESSSANPFTSSPHPSSAGAGIVCPHCGTLNKPGNHFCKSCGADLSQTERRTCPHCGAQLDGDEEFCPKCGQKL